MKRGISFILLCLFGISAFAQESIYGTDDQLATNHEWPLSIWFIPICVLIIGTIMFFVGVFVNKKIQKSKRSSSSQADTFSAKDINKNAESLFSEDLLTTNDTTINPSNELLTELQPDTESSYGELVSPVPSSITKPKILIIEDHKDIRLYLKILFNSNYQLLMAENGEDGLKLARKELPELIITDVMMPMMNGFECCKRIKEDLKTCHIPIILLTALMGDENIVKGIELGADDYLTKPFNPEILKIKVKQLIRSRQELKHIYGKLLAPAVVTQEEEIEEKPEDPFIAQIVQIVEKNMQNPEFSVKKLSEMLNMSQPTLYRRVKLLTNYTIIEFVRGVRLKRSAELLKSRQYNVQEVAEMVGYNDIPTFRKHFIDFYGTTPSTFGRDEV